MIMLCKCMILGQLDTSLLTFVLSQSKQVDKKFKPECICTMRPMITFVINYNFVLF